WTKVGRQSYTAPLNAKHNTVHPITAADRDRLLARYGGTSWNLLKSYNFPGHYARHENNTGRISELPFDPYQDAPWRLRPGLSDPHGVSFASVNFPGYSMKQEVFVITLVRNDCTAASATDAPFHRVADLAAANWTSFPPARSPPR
ncbi:alpha-L-arabinofuranosidase, partial [Streptomyces sp. JV178]|uniref:AbfB domain-containing protein n=1 Tax=Streptomyces sp. JV178 TaxID=858632 RepID=UPI000C47F576